MVHWDELGNLSVATGMMCGRNRVVLPGIRAGRADRVGTSMTRPDPTLFDPEDIVAKAATAHEQRLEAETRRQHEAELLERCWTERSRLAEAMHNLFREIDLYSPFRQAGA